jgi:hypothetical protein
MIFDFCESFFFSWKELKESQRKSNPPTDPQRCFFNSGGGFGIFLNGHLPIPKGSQRILAAKVNHLLLCFLLISI